MRNHLFISLSTLLLSLILLISCEQETIKEKRLLVFSKTAGYRHAPAIAAGKVALLKMGEEQGIAVDTTEEATAFTEENLQKYSAVIFLNTTGDVLDHIQQADFERYIQAGGGYVGIHSAADTEYEWPWYGKLAGGYFAGHPGNPNVREGVMTVHNQTHISTMGLPQQWERKDEYYDFKEMNSDINVLVTVDEDSYDWDKMGKDHPMSWYHDYDGGRAFYTNFGHTAETFSEELFLKHLLGGIQYAIGDNKLNYAAAKSLRVPEENRFLKVVYTDNLDEPMELEVMPNGNILFVERKGGIKMYNPETGQTKLVTKMDVHTRFEDGLLGMALDPNFRLNQWIYLFYSPVGEKSVQHVSRFLMVGEDSLMMESEKVIIEIPVQREKCCHSGGSLEFGPDGNLFITVGDNTNPFNSDLEFDSDGFAPMDERSGRAPHDAQRSSGNTNDLRGKILRIKPEKNGYSIPNGNLFPKDGSRGRPEIYVMGCRNPFRVAIDSRTGWIYWGDVGPDASKTKEGRGPRGYDEVNQAQTAGYYGWPYFVGNNFPYRKMDYNTGEVTDFFDPARPINNSVNNTGDTILPPARPAMIYYPYAASPDFPHVKEGGRNAMAAGVYHYDDYAHSENRFPEYYDGKVFVYDWMRAWMLALTLDEKGNLSKIEPFLPNFEFEKVIDVDLASDGTFYILEYGSKWFAQNANAVLAKIDYAEGNRQPYAKISADRLIGAAPFEVNFSSEGSFDFDEEDEIRYEWTFDQEGAVQSTEANPSFTFQTAGVYDAQVKVLDREGKSAVAKMKIQVGNEPPKIEVLLSNNRSFYWGNTPFDYQVKVMDNEDGAIGSGIDPEDVEVYFDYLPIGNDLTMIAQGHTQTGAILDGGKLINESGCTACHQMNEASIGPAYQEVAERYDSSDETVTTLANKVISGGNGNWGERMMSAHPQLAIEEAEAMVKYILALDEEVIKPSLPPTGNLATDQHLLGSEGKYLLTAKYTDKGGDGVGALTEQEVLTLRTPKVQAEDRDGHFMTGIRDRDNIISISEIEPHSHFHFKKIDLQGIEKVMVRYSARRDGFSIHLRNGSEDGEVLASGVLIKRDKSAQWRTVELPLQSIPNDLIDLYFTFSLEEGMEASRLSIDWLFFQKEGEQVNLTLGDDD